MSDKDPDDTPRTDIVANDYWNRSEREAASLCKLSRQLERELAASQAEVERLKSELHRAASLMEETGREETARRIIERTTNPTNL